MLRFFIKLRSARYARGFFRARIGVALVRRIIRLLVFEHSSYFVFCVCFALVRLGRIILLQLIAPELSMRLFLSEMLINQTFFELLGSLPKVVYLIFFVFVYSGELVTLFFIQSALIYFTAARIQKQPISWSTSFSMSTRSIPLLMTWALVELGVLGIIIFLGIIGDILSVLWDVSTSFVLPLLVFSKVSLYNIMRQALSLFKKRFATVVGIDLFIDLSILLVTALVYYLSQQPTSFLITNTQLLESNAIVLVLLVYLEAIGIAAETIAITLLFLAFTPSHKLSMR